MTECSPSEKRIAPQAAARGASGATSTIASVPNAMTTQGNWETVPAHVGNEAERAMTMKRLKKRPAFITRVASVG